MSERNKLAYEMICKLTWMIPSVRRLFDTFVFRTNRGQHQYSMYKTERVGEKKLIE